MLVIRCDGCGALIHNKEDAVRVTMTFGAFDPAAKERKIKEMELCTQCAALETATEALERVLTPKERSIIMIAARANCETQEGCGQCDSRGACDEGELSISALCGILRKVAELIE